MSRTGGPLLRSRIRKLDPRKNIGLALIWQKSRWTPLPEKTRQGGEAEQKHSAESQLVNECPAYAHISLCCSGEDPVEPAEERRKRPPCLLFGPQQQRPQCRTEAERVKCGEKHRDRNCYRELLIKAPRNARYERSGNEDG